MYLRKMSRTMYTDLYITYLAPQLLGELFSNSLINSQYNHIVSTSRLIKPSTQSSGSPNSKKQGVSWTADKFFVPTILFNSQGLSEPLESGPTIWAMAVVSFQEALGQSLHSMCVGGLTPISSHLACANWFCAQLDIWKAPLCSQHL